MVLKTIYFMVFYSIIFKFLILFVFVSSNLCMVEYIKILLCMMNICGRIAAVLGSHFRIKNGTHTTLTLIPNRLKSVIESFFIVKEIIWLL